MTSAISLMLPTTRRAGPVDMASQLSPAVVAESKQFSVERSSHDTLLQDLLCLSQTAIHQLPAAEPTPLLLAQDSSEATSRRIETNLNGVLVSGFSVGGEHRLCVPQLLSTLFHDVSITDINKTMTRLNIHMAQCSRAQMTALKCSGVVPLTAEGCGLLTRTDAERLCQTLLLRQRVGTPLPDFGSNAGTVPVRHRCFGGATGTLCPELYLTPLAETVQCRSCLRLFAADKFVLHSHRDDAEAHLCHWGFDSTHWRDYITLDDAVLEARRLTDERKAEYDKMLEEVKVKFNPVTRSNKAHKRIADQADQSTGAEISGLAPKRAKTFSGVLQQKQQQQQQQQVVAEDNFHTLLAYYQSMLAARFGALQQQQQHKLQQFAAVQQQQNPAVALMRQQQQQQLANKTGQLVADKKMEAVQSLLALSCKPQESPKKVKMELQAPKKHILHQFEEEQRRALATPPAEATPTPANQQEVVNSNDHSMRSSADSDDGGSTVTAGSAEIDDESTLDGVLRKYIVSEEGLKKIRVKIAESQRVLEQKVDSLQAQNRTLNQEMKLLRIERRLASEKAHCQGKVRLLSTAH